MKTNYACMLTMRQQLIDDGQDPDDEAIASWLTSMLLSEDAPLEAISQRLGIRARDLLHGGCEEAARDLFAGAAMTSLAVLGLSGPLDRELTEAENDSVVKIRMLLLLARQYEVAKRITALFDKDKANDHN